MMKPLLRIALALLFAISAILAHRVHVPQTTPAPLITKNEGEPEVYLGSATTESPGIPPNTTSTIFGMECTINSVAYPDQYLVMRSGVFHFHPELTKGKPKPQSGEWNWSGIWRVYRLNFLGDTHFQLWNHKTNTFMAYNATRYAYARGTSSAHNIENLWNVNSIQSSNEVFYTIQHAQPPNGYLHALTEKKTFFGTDYRLIGILPNEPDKDIYHWRIDCGNSKNH